MTAPESLLTVDDLAVHFPVRKGVFSRVSGHVRAVDGVSFSIPRGKSLSLVGESGSGKTTTGRAILRLIEPTQGRVVFDGVDLASLGSSDIRQMRKRMQLIFQDPYGSLNPRMTVYSVLAEALAKHGIVPRSQRRARVNELLKMAGLQSAAADR